MSTQVLPFDIAESEPPPAPEEDEWRDTRSRWKRSVILLVIQLVATLAPVVILVIAFAIAGDRIAAAEVAGVALRDIVIAIAVIVPFLSQTLAAPIYSTLNTVSYRDRGEVSAAVLSVLPRGAVLAVPIAAATAFGVAAFRGWGITVAVVLAVSLVLNLVMGMLMVVDFATRSFRGPVLGWLAYGSHICTRRRSRRLPISTANRRSRSSCRTDSSQARTSPPGRGSTHGLPIAAGLITSGGSRTSPGWSRSKDCWIYSTR